MLCWLVGLPLLVSLAQLVSAQPGHIFVSAPNLIRVGNTETVLVSVFNSGDVDVTVTLKNFDQSEICPPAVVTVSHGVSQVVHLFIDPDTIQLMESEDEDFKLYAKLEVSCPELNGFREEKDVLVSYEEGFVFIQTDKPIYTPGQSVNIRLLILDQFMRPSDHEVGMDVLTPQGIIVHREEAATARNGFLTHVFRFPIEPLFGNWSVVAYYGIGMKSNRSVQFEVKEYVLPTYSVELKTPDHILKGDEAVEVEVKARYVYDKPVLGTFFAKVGILEYDGEIVIKDKKAGELLANGIGYFMVETSSFGEDWFTENVGKRLYVEVSVLEAASGISENVSDTSTLFVHSPYKFKWDRTIRHFKKGLPYKVKIDLLRANGKPADQVPVRVSGVGIIDEDQEQELYGEGNGDLVTENTNLKGQVEFNIYVPDNCKLIRISLETQKPDLIRDDGTNNNARFSFDVQPHISPSVDDFIMIKLTEEIVNVDASLQVELISATNDDIPWLAYYVVSKGNISQSGVKAHGGAVIDGFSVYVSYDMAPTARIVAFYINQAGQVIADSIWIEIQRVCENQVSVRVVSPRNEPIREHLPDRNVNLQIDALPGTTVGLLAVDKAVYLLRDYHRLTSDKMYQTLDAHDTGCGPGGGADTPDVFKNAGVMVLSSASVDVDRREVYGCGTPLNPRRRRSVDEVLQQSLSVYEGDANATFACRRGHRRSSASLNCRESVEEFAEYLNRRIPGLNDTRRRELRRIFVTCCRNARDTHTAANRGRTGGQGPLADDIDDFAQPGLVRSDFKETWIFEEVQVGDNFAEQAFTIPSSITTWSISAVGLSQDYAMCVARPLDVLVRQDLFIQLHMPYSVVRLEQVEIVATIFNYMNERLQVTVSIQTPAEVCSEGNAGEFSAEKTISVGANNAASVKFVLIGLETGEWPVAVKAVATIGVKDTVSKKLRVVPEGIETSFYHSVAIDPTGTLNQPLGQDPQPRASLSHFNADRVQLVEENKQVNFFDIRLPGSTVPGSEKCEVSIIGNVLGPVVTAVIDGLDSLLTLPRGCGEQTMIYLSPNVYVLRYLTSLDSTTPELVAKAKSNILEGIRNEMTHRRADGSFSVWGTRAHYPSSTWLTAFVNKVFCHASEFEGVFVDSKVTCQAIEWLIDNAQRDYGAFYETYRVHHREMTGGVQGEATLTAFVLISIHECGCPTLHEKIQASTALATEFLETQLDNLVRPYAMAIVTYALALVQSEARHHANLMLRSMDTLGVNGTRYFAADGSSLEGGNKPYWYQVRPSAITVETTGYALLAQLAMSEITYSKSIVKWLSMQQNYGGGFASTQDTTIALQALAEYGKRSPSGELDMTCTVHHDERMLSEFQFTNENAFVQRHATPPASGSLKVTSVGTGTGKLNVKVSYNTLSEQLNARQCPFHILINAREARTLDPSQPQRGPPERPPPQRGDIPDRSRVGHLQKRDARAPNRGDLIVHVAVEVGYHKSEPTNMGIIDVGLYTGFKPIEEDLKQIVEENEYISRYEVSQRSVIFYADSIPPVDQLPKLRLEFNARREYVVGNLQPVAIKVYDYYNPTEECVKFYHPTNEDETSSTLANICEGQACVCAAGDCSDCSMSHTKDQLLDLSCASAQTYVYQIRIEETKPDEGGFKVYVAVILRVLKEADDIIRLNDRREFLISVSCTACTTELRLNSWYLVIGKTVLPYVTSDNQSGVKYILDNTAVLEFWPERRRKKVREQFIKMQNFADDMEDDNNNCQ